MFVKKVQSGSLNNVCIKNNGMKIYISDSVCLFSFVIISVVHFGLWYSEWTGTQKYVLRFLGSETTYCYCGDHLLIQSDQIEVLEQVLKTMYRKSRKELCIEKMCTKV